MDLSLTSVNAELFKLLDKGNPPIWRHPRLRVIIKILHILSVLPGCTLSTVQTAMVNTSELIFLQLINV